MNKKKAIKIVTATAIAASAFTAVAPAQSEAAASLTSQITSAKATIKKPYDRYIKATKLASLNTVEKEIKAAKQAQKDINAKIKKAKLKTKDKTKKLAEIKAYDKYITRAEGYVKAYKEATAARANLNKLVAELEDTIATGDLAAALEQYSNLQVAIKEAKKDIKDTVYGANIETLLFNKFTKPTETLLAGGVQKAIDAYKYEETKKAEAAKVNAYVAATKDLTTLEKVKAAKDAKAAINLDQLKVADQSALHDKIVEADKLVEAAEEALKVPAVQEVNAINPTKIEVKFNTAVDEKTLNKSVSINNVAVDGADLYELSEDGKTLTVRVSTLEVDKAYAVKVAGVKTVDGEEVSTYVEKVLFADSEAASIESVTAKAGSTAKTKIVEVVFSEDVKGTLANFRVDNVSPSSATFVNNVVTLELPADIESGKTHELRVVDLADQSGNKTNVTQQFTITSDTTAPVATVTATDENTIKVEFDEAVSSVDATNVKILKGNVNVTGTPGNLSDDKKSIEFTVNPLVYGENETSANLTVEVAGVKDLYNNESTKSTHSITVSKDVVAPTVSNIEGTVGTKTFVISFSEELAGSANDNVKYLPTLFKDNVKLTVNSAVLQADKDGKLTQVLVTTSADLEAGNYEVTLAEDTVTDDSLAKNKNAQVKTAFTTTSPTAETDTVKPEVSTVTVSGDVVTVTYSEDVAASAVDYKNYKIDGATIPSQSVIYFENNKKVVTIKLPKGYFNADKSDVTVEVANVSDLAGNVMNKYTKLNQAVVDTKAPTLVSAKLTSASSLVLEYDEAISTNVTSFKSGSVVVKEANGSVVKTAGGDSITTNATASVEGKKVTIALTAGTLDPTKSYTVSAEAGVGLVDQAGTDNDVNGNEVSPFTNATLVEGIAPVLTATDIFADNTYTSEVIGVTAPAISTSKFGVTKASLSEIPANIKLVYSDADDITEDVVVTGTVELNAAQDAYTYSFSSASLSNLTAGDIKVELVLVDENGNESSAYNVVADGSNYNVLKLVK